MEVRVETDVWQDEGNNLKARKYIFQLERLFRKLKNLKNKISRKSVNKSSKKKEPNSSLGIKIVSILVFLGVVLGFLVPLTRTFMEFNTSTQFKQLSYPQMDNSEKFSVLLIGLDKKDSHSFVDALVVLIVDKKTDKVSMVNINPDIAIEGGIDDATTIRRSLIPDGKDLQSLADGVSEILASEITNYIAVDKVFFEETSGYIQNIPIENEADILDPDVILENNNSRWLKGSQMLSGCCIYDYLRSDQNGSDEKLLRQLKLYPDYTKNIATWKIVLGGKDFSEVISKNVSTDMDKYELIELFYYLSRKPSDDIDKVYTREDQLIKKEKVGVYDLYYLNFDRFDKELETVLGSQEIALEQPVVELLNASNQPGLATNKARWMHNSSMNVIHIANSPIKQQSSTVYVEEVTKYPATLAKLKAVLGSDLEVIESEYPYRHIGEIVVVLGEDQL